ncbi:MAG: MATE family efflux transporter [Ruminococcus sp.]|nr:MATE family efflux transporter [Candidatus Copronaster equi]
MKVKLFSDRNFYRNLIKLALPIAFQNLMLASVAAADAIMLGSIEQDSMSAVSLATQIQFVQNMIIFALTSATAVLGAQYWGKQDKKSMNDIFCLSLRLCGIVSILFFIGCLFFPRFLMLLFTNEEVLIEIGVKYLRIAGWSYLLTGISQCYLTMMKVSDHAAVTAKLSFATVMINIVLNAVFIYGLFNAPKMGAQGAALATLISRIIEFAFSILISFRKDYIHPELKGMFSRNKLLSQDYFKCMLPLLASSLLWGIGFTTYSAFMGHMGTQAAAANSIAAVVRDLICCMCNGLASGGGIMVGNRLGSGNLEKGKEYGIRLAILAFICGIISSIIMFVLTPVVLKFVHITPEARKFLLQMMIIMSVYMIGRAVNTIIINGIFAAGGDTFFDMYSLIICTWCLAVPLAALGTFKFGWPVWIVYSCTCLDEVGKIPWVMIHFKKYKWVKDLTR